MSDISEDEEYPMHEKNTNMDVQYHTTPSPEQKKDSISTFHVKTINVKDFCSILAGVVTIPNLDHVLMQFNKNGMQLYAKPQGSPILVTSFWNISMFQEYSCGESVKKWVSKVRLENLRKKISKDVVFLDISVNNSDTPAFVFSGEQQCATGGKCTFAFNLFEWVSTDDSVDLKIDYNWHVSIASENFKKGVDFMDDQSEFISLQLDGNIFKFQGISDTGIVAEEQTHETESCQLSLKFSSLFYKKYLKVVTSSISLHKTVHLSFFPDEETETYPV